MFFYEKLKKTLIFCLIFVIFAAGCKKENDNGTENKVENTINGHEYVDLGLPSGLKWATCNIGAATPSDYGNHYAWGETLSKSEYTADNCITYEKDMSDISGNSQYDAAVTNWGRPWRMPKKSEIQELMYECTWAWTAQNGHKGYKVVGPNGKSIFLPAACDYYATSHGEPGDNYGRYWSSTPYENGLQNAYDLRFSSAYFATWNHERYYGRTIRPVSD